MRAYEKDIDIKVPNWYYKLPQKVVERISDIGLVLNSLLSRPRSKKTKETTSDRNITFYL